MSVRQPMAIEQAAIHSVADGYKKLQKSIWF